jgi:hypothetical protein
MLRGEFAAFDVAVEAATTTTANRNTNHTNAITPTAAADYATAFTNEGHRSQHRKPLPPTQPHNAPAAG